MPFYHQTAGKNVPRILAKGFEGDIWISDFKELQYAQDQKLASENPSDPLPGDFLLEIDITVEIVEANDLSGKRRDGAWKIPGEILNRCLKPTVVKHDYEDETRESLLEDAEEQENSGNSYLADKYRNAVEVLDSIGWSTP